MCEPIRLQEILYPVLVMARTGQNQYNVQNVQACFATFKLLAQVLTFLICSFFLVSKHQLNEDTKTHIMVDGTLQAYDNDSLEKNVRRRKSFKQTN